MNAKQAREELAQYVRVDRYNCPAQRWGHKVTVYTDGSESQHVVSRESMIANGLGDCIKRYEWRPMDKWQTLYLQRHIVLQLCLSWAPLELPPAKAYAAQVNYNREIRRLYADAGRSVRRLARLPANYLWDLTSDPEIRSLIFHPPKLYDKFKRAVEASGSTLRWETLPRLRARAKRRRRAG